MRRKRRGLALRLVSSDRLQKGRFIVEKRHETSWTIKLHRRCHVCFRKRALSFLLCAQRQYLDDNGNLGTLPSDLLLEILGYLPCAQAEGRYYWVSKRTTTVRHNGLARALQAWLLPGYTWNDVVYSYRLTPIGPSPVTKRYGVSLASCKSWSMI